MAVTMVTLLPEAAAPRWLTALRRCFWSGLEQFECPPVSSWCLIVLFWDVLDGCPSSQVDVWGQPSQLLPGGVGKLLLWARFLLPHLGETSTFVQSDAAASSFLIHGYTMTRGQRLAQKVVSDLKGSSGGILICLAYAALPLLLLTSLWGFTSCVSVADVALPLTLEHLC